MSFAFMKEVYVMELGMNIQYFSKTLGIAQTAEILSDAGFRYLDYTPPMEDAWQEKMEEDMKIFVANNLTVYQCHAPFNRYKRWGSAEKHKELVMRSLKAASRMQAKYLVVHGDEFDFERRTKSWSR